MRFPKYVQHWVDAEGRPHCYFRRRGFPRARLPGLPWSPQFMTAYEQALGGPQLAVGAKRTRPGSVHAAITGYFTSLEFRTLAAGTQRVRRHILLRFDAVHGDKPIALLPPEFIAHVLRGMKPFAARKAQSDPPLDAVLRRREAGTHRSHARHQATQGQIGRLPYLDR